jgi:hypothetical protein
MTKFKFTAMHFDNSARSKSKFRGMSLVSFLRLLFSLSVRFGFKSTMKSSYSQYRRQKSNFLPSVRLIHLTSTFFWTHGINKFVYFFSLSDFFNPFLSASRYHRDGIDSPHHSRHQSCFINRLLTSHAC